MFKVNGIYNRTDERMASSETVDKLANLFMAAVIVSVRKTSRRLVLVSRPRELASRLLQWF